MQSIVVLISSASQAITTVTMEMLGALILCCSTKTLLALVKGDLIPQLVITLNPLSLPFDNAVDIHNNLMTTVRNSLWLATPYYLAILGIYNHDEQQAVRETVLKQVLAPSEQYVYHLCINHFSIVDGKQSFEVIHLFVALLRISPCHQPTMEFVLHMPVFLTIPSCLTLFANNYAIWFFLINMVEIQRELNGSRGEVQQMEKTVQQMLKMEGICDVIETKLRNDKTAHFGGEVVSYSIIWNNQQGMNLSYLG
ncbi:hypothetical protein BLNAU_21133 [Blattamonas nauphoetae]|uniref:Uncharacterized protein n=1 Tax=Blattamonas nauphoetae TaxID=2049346 RepID=A0ABQ9X0W1_9EUKA|nr:hypothetical protein BLNAU_21133 [Blattamonas nauphoetae]